MDRIGCRGFSNRSYLSQCERSTPPGAKAAGLRRRSPLKQAKHGPAVCPHRRRSSHHRRGVLKTAASGGEREEAMAGGDLSELTAIDLATEIRERRVSPVEAVDCFLERIARIDPQL